LCFDISSTKIKQLIEINQTAEFYHDFDYKPFFHKNGFSHPNVAIIKMDEPKTIYPSIWGYIPDWGMDDIPLFRKKYNTLNAKSETLLLSPTYKRGALKNRCLIIADGFFEPHRSNGISIPYYCYIPTNRYEDGRDVFVFAGIYSELEEGVYSCSIITTKANDFFSEIHNVKKRMPLVLNNDLKNEWLLVGLNDGQIKELLEEGYTKQVFKAHAISRNLYKRSVDTNVKEILNPVEYNDLFDQ